MNTPDPVLSLFDKVKAKLAWLWSFPMTRWFIIGLAIGFALCRCTAAEAAVSITENTQVNLLRASTNIGTFPGWEACLAEARRLANASTATSGTVTYSCQTERRRVIAAYSPTPPPPAVDCVVGAWSEWTGGEWSACANSQQSRLETRTRQIVTAPSNGGAACPPLTETRTATQPCSMPPPPVSGITPQPGYSVVLDSGGLGEGGVITITSAAGGFGVKVPAKPYLWAPMDTSMNPSPLGLTPGWAPGSTGVMAFAAGCGPGGGGCAQGGASNGSSTNTWVLGVLSPASFDWNSYGQKSYVYRKSKRDFSYSGDRNVKIVRLWNVTSSGGISGPNMYFATSNGRYGIEGVPTPYQDYTMGAGNLAAAKGPVGTWYSEELFFKSNSNSAAADADFRLVTNGGPELVSFPNTTWMTHTLKFKADSGSQGDGKMRMLFAVHMLVEGSDGWPAAPAGSRYWADDVYVDSSWARVMVADCGVFAQARHREIQIPIDWSDTAVKVALHAGEAPFAGQCIYVVDASGAGRNVARFD